jgi:proteasome accessory factor B
MAAPRTERLLNLVICLLASRRYVTKEQIRQVVPQYADCATDEAFERMFERDKDDLREMGIPLETGSNDVLFDDEVGYRIPKDAYALPEISFDAEEVAVLGLAARMWQHATLAGATSRALRKLESVGVEIDVDALSVVEPRVDAAEAAFGPLWRAVHDRRRTTFTYSRGGGSPAERHLEPWGLVSWHGRWYVVGHDLDREDTRCFRLSRIHDDVKLVGPQDSFTVPEGIDITESVEMLAQPAPTREAHVRIRPGSAVPLRRRGTVLAVHDDGGDGSDKDNWTHVTIGFDDVEQLAAEICGYGPRVVVDEPDDLRDAVVRRVRSVLEAVSA